ncbi:hypothetical protein GT347_03510 [Xylophilus rhododendri]|uniref:Uncharacterized protein n=1 Tax=Xylophilus rhododendri TaxID=2697032 RepID=A0A857J078_9BURK|nr:hypothetical protein [Xylophilus rhododendri]QHI97126.1 hypothetical protein GT347_03510 [Xylophilus rhododendri]
MPPALLIMAMAGALPGCGPGAATVAELAAARPGSCAPSAANYWRECSDGENATNYLDGRSDALVKSVAPGNVSWAPGQSFSGYFQVSDANIDYAPGDHAAKVRYGFWGTGQSGVVIDNDASAFFSVGTITATDFVHGNKLYHFDITCLAPGTDGRLMLTFNYYGPRLRTYIGSVHCRPVADQASPSATVG